MTLRTNTLRIVPAELAAGLTKAGYPAEGRTPVPEEITMLGGAPPVRAKLFRHGFCTVQDPAAMLGAHLLEPAPGQSVLDLCAAPGGKTTHLAELAEGKAAVVACDTHLNKLRRLRDHAARLETPGVGIVCADGREAPWPPGTFERVLVDAPCSGLGTLRRRPDLKLRAKPETSAKLAELQVALLRRAIALCKNGGLVVYGVCTLGDTETRDVIARATEDTCAGLEDGPSWMEQWRTRTGMYETAPAADGLDGFFWTRLRIRSST
jgi:16S rRNA (cytosine967-C5)-methyltransferase